MRGVKSMIPKSARRFSEKIVLRGISLLAAVAFGATACAIAQTQAQAQAQTQAPAQDEPRGDAGNGQRIYLAVGCFTCHGRSGQGGAYNGPAPILASTAFPFDGFKGQIRNPSNDMPAYSDAVLSDKDVADIYAFVKSLPSSRPAKDISILNN
ncbi:MAG: cytochrome c [Xanthobacteraceae bacterium]